MDPEKASLHEVDPTPVVDIEDDQDSTHAKKPITRSTTGSLGLSQHSTTYYLTAVQRYSSYVFSAFATMHIVNTSIVPLITRSVPASEPYLLLTRPYYQSPLAEPLVVIIPLYAHILSGLALRIYRRNQNAKRFGDAYSAENKKSFLVKFWPKLSAVSKLGYQLTALTVGHMAINRFIPKFAAGGSNVDLSYVSHAFAKHPVVSYAGFSALLTVGCLHITWGYAKYFGWTPVQVTAVGAERELQKKRRWYTINGIAAALIGLWMAGSFGVIAQAGPAPGWLGKQYDELYKMIPVVGRWL